MNVKNLVLGIGIIVVFALALGYGIQAFYPAPEYDDFCSGRDSPRVPLSIEDKEGVCPAVCTDVWELNEVQCITEPCDPVCEFNDCGSGCGADGFTTFDTKEQCELVASGKDCFKEHDGARDKYSWGVFLICIIVGVIALIVGYSILSLEPVGSALMGSGIWSFFYGGIINWRNFGEIWRFVLLFVVLVLLIWFAWKINSPKKKKGWMFWKK